jgi:hypothetical protein
MTNPGHLPSPGRFGCPTLAKLGWVFTLILLLLPTTRAQDDQSTFTLKVESNIVLTNIVVRDKKTGAIVRGLTRNDFTIQENGKPQRIESPAPQAASP